MKSLSTTARIAWTALAVNVITVLGGTLVRATGSGAGCGESWPTCHGSIMPGFGEVSTRIEFSHRAVSGLALISLVILVISVYRNFPRGSAARRAVRLSAIAIVIESLLGAWLVLARLVEDDASIMRAISVPIHLVNTLFLLGALTATAWIVTRGQAIRWLPDDRRKLWVSAGFLLFLGATGAIAALADTLFPVESVAHGLAADFDSTAHFLTRLRTIHPVLAVLASAYLLRFAASTFGRARRPALALIVLILAQLSLGVLNVLLLTPIAIQILHLLLADLIWIALLILGAELGRASVGSDPAV
jgi:cytochrome c oxidase assembly protein subunit 15/protoheme IX farnesyltransferase